MPALFFCKKISENLNFPHFPVDFYTHCVYNSTCKGDKKPKQKAGGTP
nr:MAG TPA: hypothetical protein [Caudoviricetes sp.]